ncbi:MAG: hypothetical protein PWQ67_2650 [Clostridia bacterium]|jgi:hypothetical protein|nr:hypothetical protein [Clostridia bacterium]
MNILPVEKICVDAATENCPCAAAITKDCPVCNILNHGVSCDCSQTWAGICIYEKFLQAGTNNAKNVTNSIQVLQKISLDDSVKLICYVPDEFITTIQSFQGIKISLYYYKKMISLFGVVTKILKKENLVSLIINDTNYEVPIKYGPILNKGTSFEFKPLGQVLPVLPLTKMKRVLISVDGFWLGLTNSLMDILKTAGKEVTVIGPLSRETISKLNLTQADKIISTEHFEELKNSNCDTVISLNTPSLQRKLNSLIWKEKMDKTLIAVNNQFCE